MFSHKLNNAKIITKIKIFLPLIFQNFIKYAQKNKTFFWKESKIIKKGSNLDLKQLVLNVETNIEFIISKINR